MPLNNYRNPLKVMDSTGHIVPFSWNQSGQTCSLRVLCSTGSGIPIPTPSSPFRPSCIRELQRETKITKNVARHPITPKVMRNGAQQRNTGLAQNERLLNVSVVFYPRGNASPFLKALQYIKLRASGRCVSSVDAALLHNER